MRIIVSVSILVIFFASISFTQDKESKDKTYLASVINIRPKHGAAKLRLKIYRYYNKYDGSKNDYDDIYKIKIYKANKGKLIQTLDENDCEYIVRFDIGDYNFDGYKDIYLKNSCMMLNNCYGHVFLYNPSTGKYKLAKEFDDLITIRVSKTKKRIYSLNRSQAGASWQFDVYKYINKKLTLIISYSQSPGADGKYYYGKDIRMSNGKMKTVISKILNEPRFEPMVPR
ncbi:MAG: hypothetical protein NTV87_16405 [Ignavibacteriae bacterium]|nr:hypothetical protein [Ignavibacteriota bacterium]